MKRLIKIYLSSKWNYFIDQNKKKKSHTINFDILKENWSRKSIMIFSDLFNASNIMCETFLCYLDILVHRIQSLMKKIGHFI